MKAAIVLACVFSLHAQISTTLNRLPNGLDELRIRNESSIPVVAFAVTAWQLPQTENSIKAPVVVYSDALIEPASKPLLAGEDRVAMLRGYPRPLRAPAPDPSARHVLQGPVAAAGFFADGTTTGDAALLTRLILRRSNMLLAVETSIETLSDAGRRNIPRNQLIEQFQKMASSMNRWYLPAEQQVGRGVYQSIMGKLLNLPIGEPGSAFPPAAFIGQETAALNRQRVLLLESQPSLEDAVLVSVTVR